MQESDSVEMRSLNLTTNNAILRLIQGNNNQLIQGGNNEPPNLYSVQKKMEQRCLSVCKNSTKLITYTDESS